MGIHIGKRIAYLRKTAKLTQKELAASLNVSPSHLGNLENGRFAITEELVSSLSKQFHTQTCYLLECEMQKDQIQHIELIFSSLLDNQLEKSKALLDEIAYPNPSLEYEVSSRLLYAVYYFKNREFEKAVKIKNSYLSIYFTENELTGLSLRLQKCYDLYLSELYFFESNFPESYSHCERLLDSVTNNKQKVIVLLFLAKIAIMHRYYGKALIHTDIAISMIQDSGEFELLADAYVRLSAIYLHLNLYDESLEIIDKLEKISERFSLIEFKAHAYQHKGYIYSETNRYQEALSCYGNAYNLVSSSEKQVKVIISLIFCYIKMKELSIAKHYILLAREKTLSEYERMIILSYEGEIYLYEDKEQCHWKCQKESYAYFKKHRYYIHLEYIYDYLAKYYYEKRQYKKSATYFVKKENLKNEKN